LKYKPAFFEIVMAEMYTTRNEECPIGGPDIQSLDKFWIGRFNIKDPFPTVRTPILSVKNVNRFSFYFSS